MALALVAAACSGSGGGHPAPAVPRRGGVLRLAVSGIGSLDPAQASSPVQLVVAAAVYQPLTSVDPVTLAVRAALASGWTASADQRHWDFTIRPGARFSDGSPVVADDVVATIDRIAAKGSGSPVAGVLAPVRGFEAVNGAGTASHLAGLSAPDPSHVHLDLDAPFADLALALANPAFGVVSRAAERAVPAPTHPPGSGPYVFTTGPPGTVSLARAGGTSAYLDRIEITAYPSPAAAYAAFTRGAADWATVPPTDMAAAGQKYGTAGFRPLAAELFYGFNLKDPAFADVRVRKAVVEAIDRAPIVEKAYDGSALPLSGVIVQGIPGYVPDACGPVCAPDPAGAKSLLAAVGGAAPSFHIDFDQEDPAQESVAADLRSGLAGVGVTARLRPKALADYQAFALSGKAQLFRLGWVAPYPSADAFLVPLFQSASPTNLTHFSDPDVDKLLAAARSEADPAKRVTDDQQAEKLILAKVAVIPIAQFSSHAVIGPSVHGLVMDLLGGFNPASVWVAKR